MRTSKKPLLGLCRLCRYVSFELHDTRLILCRLCHHPLGVTHATQGQIGQALHYFDALAEHG